MLGVQRTFFVLSLVASLLASSREVRACGGCFAPPGAVQTVTAHRMVLSLSRTQTTLWDQFSYSGNPTEFSWILPIQNGPMTRVNLADDRFMTMMDNVTAPILRAPQAPTRFCPGCFLGAEAGASDASSASDSGVTVYREEAVGPYQVAIIGGTDPMAIRNWLRDNNYTLPASMAPVIDHYTAMRSDYVALRLRAGEGINRMSPVRVTTPGYNPTLPLRMIGAGIADKVGLQLIVFSDARVEARNFANGELSDMSFTYDFNNPTSPSQDFLSAFNRLNTMNMGRLWLAEVVDSYDRFVMIGNAQAARRGMPRPDEQCNNPFLPPWFRAEAGCDNDGGDAGMRPDPEVDVQVAYEGLGNQAVVTRLRADLNASRLDQDLVLQASTRGNRARMYNYGNILNMPPEPPPCPPQPDCGFFPGPFDSGTPFDSGVRFDSGVTFDSGFDATARPDGSSIPVPRTDAGIRGAEVGEVTAGGGLRCSTGSTPGSARGLGVSVALLGLAFAVRNRKRSQ